MMIHVSSESSMTTSKPKLVLVGSDHRSTTTEHDRLPAIASPHRNDPHGYRLGSPSADIRCTHRACAFSYPHTISTVHLRDFPGTHGCRSWRRSAAGANSRQRVTPRLVCCLICRPQQCIFFVRVLVRKFFKWRSLVSLLTLIVNLAAGLLVANQSCNLYPDFDSFLPTSHYNRASAEQIPEPDQQPASISLAEWNKLRTAGMLQSANLPAKRTRVSMPVPTPHSGLQARNALVFLPPAGFSTPRPPASSAHPDEWIPRRTHAVVRGKAA